MIIYDIHVGEKRTNERQLEQLRGRRRAEVSVVYVPARPGVSGPFVCREIRDAKLNYVFFPYLLRYLFNLPPQFAAAAAAKTNDWSYSDFISLNQFFF